MLFKTRYNILPAVFLLYFLPLLAIGMYGTRKAHGNSWEIMSIGLFLVALGSLCLFLLMRYWENEIAMKYMAVDEEETIELEEESIQDSEENLALQQADARAQEMEIEIADLNHQNEELQSELIDKQQLILELKLHKEQLQESVAKLRSEFHLVKESFEEKLEQNQIFLREHQQTITEQRQVIEVKQQQIQQLDDKVRDLTYEIKTLLHLAEKTQINDQRNFSSPDAPLVKAQLFDVTSEASSLQIPAGPQISKEEQANLQLKQCLDIAQKMTGANHYSNRSGKRTEFSMEHYALDLRCLIDSLRNENSCAILIYSQKENKFIFGNNQVKPLLGWSAEKFIQNFPSIIETSIDEWNATLGQLAYKNETEAELSMKSKNGTLVPIKCYLGVIATGIFRSNILGLLYHADENAKLG